MIAADRSLGHPGAPVEVDDAWCIRTRSQAYRNGQAQGGDGDGSEGPVWGPAIWSRTR